MPNESLAYIGEDTTTLHTLQYDPTVDGNLIKKPLKENLFKVKVSSSLTLVSLKVFTTRLCVPKYET